MIYFTADEHHDHLNRRNTGIIDYCKRPFKDISTNTAVIIERHNEFIKEDDIVYHLGDFSLRGYEHRSYYEGLMRKYKKVKYRHLILGNHDYMRPFDYHKIGFTSVHTVQWLSYGGFDFLLAHDPAYYQPAVYDKIMLCGHIHNLFKIIPHKKIVNVGVDAWNFYPVSIDTIIETLKTEKIL
jgi:calcineurin-like phosphoesterase family protein